MFPQKFIRLIDETHTHVYVLFGARCGVYARLLSTTTSPSLLGPGDV